MQEPLYIHKIIESSENKIIVINNQNNSMKINSNKETSDMLKTDYIKLQDKLKKIQFDFIFRINQLENKKCKWRKTEKFKKD